MEHVMQILEANENLRIVLKNKGIKIIFYSRIQSGFFFFLVGEVFLKDKVKNLSVKLTTEIRIKAYY